MTFPPRTIHSTIGEPAFPVSELTRSTFLLQPQGAALPPVDIPYLQFPGLLQFSRLRHAVYTRLGGVSLPPFQSLNVSGSVGDHGQHVAVNLQRIRRTFGSPHLVEMNQVHGSHLLILNHMDAATPDNGAPPADASATNLPGVALMVKQADCQAVILFDPVKRALANVHCGWRGNIAGFLSKVIDKLRASFGCSPVEMRAAIGPSLGPCCAEFTSHEALFPAQFRRFMVRKNHFDLWEISRRQLLEAGLKKNNIEIAGICTRCRTDLFFSYRAEGSTGRFATVVMLE